MTVSFFAEKYHIEQSFIYEALAWDNVRTLDEEKSEELLRSIVLGYAKNRGTYFERKMEQCDNIVDAILSTECEKT